MKIGIFGNTNNYPLILAQGLRALGAEVRLVVNRPELLHRPEGREPTMRGSYPDWIADFKEICQSHVIIRSPLIPEVVRFFGNDIDAVILNDVGLALHEHFSCPVLALLSGSDLLYHASYDSIEERISGWPDELRNSEEGRLVVSDMRECVSAQRRGISQASAVSFMLPGVIPEGDEILRELGISSDDPRRFFVYLSDTISLSYTPPPLRRRIRIFNGARIIWKLPLPPGFSALDLKGTDILIRGFAEFLELGGEGELRLVRKGYDVDDTYKLIEDLGISKDVIWLDELGLSEFYAEVEQADVVCDQFGTSLPGLVALDSMVIGRPVVSNFRLDVLGPYYPEPRPIFQAATQEEVRDHLFTLFSDPKLRVETGLRAAEYVRRHRSPQSNASECLKRLGLMPPSSD